MPLLTEWIVNLWKAQYTKQLRHTKSANHSLKLCMSFSIETFRHELHACLKSYLSCMLLLLSILEGADKETAIRYEN